MSLVRSYSRTGGSLVLIGGLLVCAFSSLSSRQSALAESTTRASLVTLAASPVQVPTGGTVTLTWTGFSPTGNDWISLHPLTVPYTRGETKQSHSLFAPPGSKMDPTDAAFCRSGRMHLQHN